MYNSNTLMSPDKSPSKDASSLKKRKTNDSLPFVVGEISDRLIPPPPVINGSPFTLNENKGDEKLHQPQKKTRSSTRKSEKEKVS